MQKTTTKSIIYIALLLTVLHTGAMLLFIHSFAKLPSEPLWGPPTLIYESWQFALILGLSLPFPELTAPLALLLLFLISFYFYRFILRRLAILFRLS